VNYALQPMMMFGSSLPLNSRVDQDSLVKTEFELTAPSSTIHPVKESFISIGKEQLLCKEEKPEQFKIPLTSSSVASDGTGLSLSASTVPSVVTSTRCKTESTDTESSVFCPTIVDVRSVKMEPEGVHVGPLSSNVMFSLPDASSSSIQSGCGQVEKLTATNLQCNNNPSCLSHSNSCITSDSATFSSQVSFSSVSLRPLASFAGSASSKMTSTVAADHRASAVIKKEFLFPERSCLSSAKDSVPQLNCAKISARNSSESSGVRSTKFADNELTAHSSATRADDVGGGNLSSRDRSAKTIANSSGSVSARDKTAMPRTDDTKSKKYSYVKTANVDGSVKGNHAGRRKSDTGSFHSAGKESKMSSAMPDVESRKRTYHSTGGMYV